jgi:glucose/arabinose dehydrogenase
MGIMGGIIPLLFIITIIHFFLLSEVYGEPVIIDDDYIVEKFVGGLELPTTMAFIGDDMLVLEKDSGKVIRIQDNGLVYMDPVLDVSVRHNFYSGMLGITTTTEHVFLYYTEAESANDTREFDDTQAKNRVYQYDWDGETLVNPVLIKEFIAQQNNDHHGGVMTTGLNNEVYFAIGDQGQSGVFENRADDPCYIIDFVDSVCPSKSVYETSSIFKIDTENDNSVELFAMGIRNSFGLGVDPVTGYLWDTENGANYYDEINLVMPGFNSGWKRVMGPVDKPNSDTGGAQAIPPQFENFVYSDPELSWYNTVGPTAIVFPNLISFGKYSDGLFVGDFHNGRIHTFQLNSDRTEFIFPDPTVDVDSTFLYNDFFAINFRGGISDIEFRDDAMYVVSIMDGSIYKIYPKDPLSPLKQYKAGIVHKKIVCKSELMPIMRHSGGINCVYPKTALILIDEVGWSTNQSKIPKIELKNQDLQGLNFEYMNLANSDFRGSNFNNTKISNVDFTRANLSNIDLTNNELTGTILTEADLSNANLAGVDLSGKDLTGTILTEANLSNTNLAGAILTDANLVNSVLNGTILNCVGHPICIQ